MQNEKGELEEARESLRKSAEAYLSGFMLSGFGPSRRDYRFGLNAASMYYILGGIIDPSLIDELLSQIEKSLNDLANGNKVWDLTSLLEVYFLKGDKDRAEYIVRKILDSNPDEVILETIVSQLKLLSEASSQRHEQTDWMKEIIAELDTNLAQTTES